MRSQISGKNLSWLYTMAADKYTSNENSDVPDVKENY